MGLAIVLAVRLTAPLAVLRWPFAGALLAIAADTVDILIFQLTEFPRWGYHPTDKALDVYYIAIEAAVAQRWAALPGATASALFAYRIAGTAIYELTGARTALFVFPNLFEFYFLFYAATLTFRPAYALGGRRNAAWMVALLVPKMGQEYMLHYAKWLDHLVAVDIIRDVFRAVRGWLGG